MKTFQNLGDFFGDDQVFGTAVSEALNQLKAKKDQDDNELELGTVSNTSKFKMKWEPVISFNSSSRTNTDQTNKKSCGFTLAPDDQGDITVSVYRAPQDSLWRKKTAVVMDNVDYDENRDVFGSYVFYTEAGATYCIHEKEEKTKFYNKGTIINNPTMAIAVPEMSIDRYEISNVPVTDRNGTAITYTVSETGTQQYGYYLTTTGNALQTTLTQTGGTGPYTGTVTLTNKLPKTDITVTKTWSDFDDKYGLKIPQIGWNSLTFQRPTKIFDGLKDDSYVYFVHSFYVQAEDESIVAATCEYGNVFHAACESGNIFGCQFHPEKSSNVGMKILENFVNL